MVWGYQVPCSIRISLTHSEVLAHPPGRIVMLPEVGLMPTGAPPIEPMQPGCPGLFGRVKRSIAKAEESLNIFTDEDVAPGVHQEWAKFFQREEALVTRCTATADAPLYDGPEQYVAFLPCVAPEGPAVLTQQQAPTPPELDLDPVVHSDFTASQRAALQAASRQPPRLAPGGLVLLRLPFGAPMPHGHKLPVCLGVLPRDFDVRSVPDGALIDFQVLSTTARDLAGSWKAPVGEGADALILRLPRRSIIISGIELTQANKLNAPSIKRIMASVQPFELTPAASAPAPAGIAAAGF